MKRSKLILRSETVRRLSALELADVVGGVPRESMVTDEMGLCCGTLWCNTRADRDCWGTYGGCPG